MRLCVLVARITIESVCIICRMDVVARIYRRFDSSTIYDFLLSFMLTEMAVLKSDSIKYRAGEEKPIEPGYNIII